MAHLRNLIAAPLFAAGALVASHASAGSLNCPTGVDLTGNTNYVQFGDAISYSLPILGMPVQSSPGQIGGCIIVTSGPGGVLTNTGGGVLMDNAYNNEQGGTQPYFQTGTANSPDPGGANQFTGDTASTWDINVQTLLTFLDGGSPIFYFNHNQVNSGGGGNVVPSIDQDLFVWAQLILYDDSHNPVLVCNLQSVPGGTDDLVYNFGIPGGTPGNCTNTVVGDGTVATQDFVRASGQVCIDNATQDVVSCFNPDGSARTGVTAFNENLGANEVANAILVPTLNTYLATHPNFNGTMSIDLRMGCLEANASDTYLTDPQAYLQNPDGNCPLGSVTNNGYEQVFLTSTAAPVLVPEPQTLALFAVGLIALGWTARRVHKS
jgi:hypothetical protein